MSPTEDTDKRQVEDPAAPPVVDVHGTPVVTEYLRALRPHQWVKNALVLVAPVAAHAVDPVSYLWAAGAFVVMSLVASAGYVLNDIVDVDHDREHPSKRQRPLAAGKAALSPWQQWARRWQPWVSLHRS